MDRSCAAFQLSKSTGLSVCYSASYVFEGSWASYGFSSGGQPSTFCFPDCLRFRSSNRPWPAWIHLSQRCRSGLAIRASPSPQGMRPLVCGHSWRSVRYWTPARCRPHRQDMTIRKDFKIAAPSLPSVTALCHNSRPSWYVSVWTSPRHQTWWSR